MRFFRLSRQADRSRPRKMSILLWLSLSLLISEQLQAQIAVIVNADNPVESLTKAELKRIYLAEMIRWDFAQDKRVDVILVDYRGDVGTGETFYQTTTGMSPVKVRMKWLGRIFNGELLSLPISMESERKLIRFVAENAGAIGFIRAADLDPSVTSVKTIEVEGKAIGHKDYPLR